MQVTVPDGGWGMQEGCSRRDWGPVSPAWQVLQRTLALLWTQL